MLVVRNNQPVNNLFDNFFNDFVTETIQKSNQFSPKSNIIEQDEAYNIEMLVPGFDKKNINIKAEKDILTVSGEKEAQKEDEKDQVIFREFSANQFSRSFTLSNDVDINKIEATYEAGVLRISVPKLAESLIKKTIEIK